MNKNRVRTRQRRSERRLLTVLLYLALSCIFSDWRLSHCTLVAATADDEEDILAHQHQEEEAKEDSPSIVIRNDGIEDSLFDPLQADSSCNEEQGEDCFAPPESTIETETRIWDATCFKGPGGLDEADDGTGESPAFLSPNDSNKEEEEEQPVCGANHNKGETTTTTTVDVHWGSDQNTLKMRDQLRNQAQEDPLNDQRPPIFLVPGLASTRLVAWKLKKCHGIFGGDIKVQDNVWLNINLVIQMGTVNVDCMKECLKLGTNQSDTDDWSTGCKLRPDEGLDAIASLAPGGIGSSLLVGGTNTVYAWLIQWLADNLGYDVTNIVGLPFDWRLSPDKMEARDGFLSIMRRRMEAAVASNGQPGIMIAHSMGNSVFRYFLDWLRVQMRQETYDEFVRRARRRAQNLKKAEFLQQQQQQKRQEESMKRKKELEDDAASGSSSATGSEEEEDSLLPGWMTGVVSGIDEWYEWLTSEQQQQQDQQSMDSEEELLDQQLWELAKDEGDAKFKEWIEAHIWTYVGLSATMLGAVNPLRAVISGENMGLPINDDVAREMEITFGSTHTINPVSTATGFCDDWNTTAWGETGEFTAIAKEKGADRKLACLDDIMTDIELSSPIRDPWKNHPALRSLIRDRVDWDKGKPMIRIDIEHCQKNGPCEEKEPIHMGAKDVQNGHIFDVFDSLWKEEGDPLIVKREQLEESFIFSNVSNMLDHTWERPLIKHVIMAYGVDYPTEVGYLYKKTHTVDENGTVIDDPNAKGGLPHLSTVLWEEAGGQMLAEQLDVPRGGIADHFMKKKPKREPFDTGRVQLHRSGDGSVPYLSLSWVHTWLLHAARARRFSDKEDRSVDHKNVLDHIQISHRPNGEIDWLDGPPPPKLRVLDPQDLVGNSDQDKDTGTQHPHGTRYKPEMLRYHNEGTSRTTGVEYTTTILEAEGIEHKEATRNYDILAAVFKDVLKYMHDDFGLVGDDDDDGDAGEPTIIEEKDGNGGRQE